ncbi:MAG: aminotransferase class I/II-fold pyridoxal phosphate-dependent enzyme [Aerococcaceae bacterium]|nr:aminotransferase class I/II-fold pyridoxal phosphate-dependent enzyme [Aerococcaceae bacterium]
MPLLEALEGYVKRRTVRFDVPGHKGGRGNAVFREFIGDRAMLLDVNSSKPLDNLCHPVSVIQEALDLAAEAFGAAHCEFMVSGTTGAVQAMILSTCKRGDKIIMPRNVHRSAINALVVCGAEPVYINPGVNEKLGIALGMSVQDIERAILANPDAKAILVNNPTYYGICSNLPAIVKLAHQHDMKVLVDEAHGCHFYFGENMPISAMAAGADMAAVSVHKTGGSLTQSSVLLMGENVDRNYVRQVINLTQTTSASYLLLTSLDAARQNLALNGKQIFKEASDLAQYAREQINQLGQYYAYGPDLIDGDNVYDFDVTKLSVYTRDIGLAGIEVYDRLRDDYNMQIELGDIGNILAIFSAGDRKPDVERLISALTEIKREQQGFTGELFKLEYIEPQVKMTPQEAFYAECEKVRLEEAIGRISGEFVMAYPPGIPILAPGEAITQEIIDYTLYAKEKGCQVMGTEDMTVETIYVVKKEAN